jgi:hypothetical protein
LPTPRRRRLLRAVPDAAGVHSVIKQIGATTTERQPTAMP